MPLGVSADTLAPAIDLDPITVYEGDCREVMAALPAESVDAIVTDPPYGLHFMGRDWDGFGTPAGFQAWTEEWGRAALRVLKPGGHALVFGGTRTYHRMASGLEDAGFEVRDALAWLYGTGFPKSRNVADDIGAGAPEAAPWVGWGTALKPAHEPVALLRKPLHERTVADQVLATGTGAINIDACRIEGEPWTFTHGPKTGRTGGGIMGDPAPREGTAESHPGGRWPANVALDEDAAAMLDAQAGEYAATEAFTLRRGSTTGRSIGGNAYGAANPHESTVGYGDSGGRSRFFYCPKVSPKERGDGNTHPTVKPLALMRWLVRLITPPGGVVLDPFAGSGSTLLAARAEGFRAVGIEREPEYVEIIARRAGEQLALALA